MKTTQAKYLKKPFIEINQHDLKKDFSKKPYKGNNTDKYNKIIKNFRSFIILVIAITQHSNFIIIFTNIIHISHMFHFFHGDFLFINILNISKFHIF